MSKKLFIETFGCQMNVNDTEKIYSMLASDGYEQTPSIHEADLVILNTCSVRAKAEEKVYSHLANYKVLKRARPSMLLGVGGCVAQQEGDKLLEKVRHLDFVFGTHTLHRLPQIVENAGRGIRSSNNDFLDTDTRRDLFASAPESGNISRFVTIMQGCDNFCSYCVVPHVRGREVSRRSADILDEINKLAESGASEITLLGQNVNSYGLKENNEISFSKLIRKVASIQGIERIRFTTSHPKDVSDELIHLFEEIPKLCSHFHLPLQSGSDRILSMMNRGYTVSDYLQTVYKLRKTRPDISITSDIIVGFPGETEEDFSATISILEEIRYSDIFSFMYSERPFTKASEMEERLSRDEKQDRLVRLQALQMAITVEINKDMTGTLQQVLVEGESRRKGQVYGRTSGNRIVNFDGDSSLAGKYVDVIITEARQTSLTGRLKA